MLTLFANRKLVSLVGENVRVFAVCEQDGTWASGASAARQLAIDTLIQ